MNDVPIKLTGCAVLPPMEPRRSEKPPDADRPKRRFAVRFALLNRFVDETAGTLTRSELLVWLTLYRDSRSGVAETGQTDIARRSGLNARTVRWAIDRLKSRGLVDIVRQGGLGKGASRYRLFAKSLRQ